LPTWWSYELKAMKETDPGYSQTFIAKSMGRNKSTISRELSRNTGVRNQLWGA
jgi:IS30 family transposase